MCQTDTSSAAKNSETSSAAASVMQSPIPSAVAAVIASLRDGSLPEKASIVRSQAEKTASAAITSAKELGTATTDLVKDRKTQLVTSYNSHRDQIVSVCTERKQQLENVVVSRMQPKACQVTSFVLFVVERSVDVMLPETDKVAKRTEVESLSGALPRLSELKSVVSTRSSSRARALQVRASAFAESPLPWVERSPRDLFFLVRGKTVAGYHFAVVYCEPKLQWVNEKLACSVYIAQVRAMAARQREQAHQKAQTALQGTLILKENAKEWKVTAVEWSDATVKEWKEWKLAAKERTEKVWPMAVEAKHAVDARVETAFLAGKDRLAPVVQKSAGFAKQSAIMVIGEERTDSLSNTLLAYAPTAAVSA